MNLPEATASGDRKRALEALRDLLAESLVEVDPDKRAPLAARLIETLNELDEFAVPDERKGTVLDELKSRRAARLPAPTGEGSAAN